MQSDREAERRRQLTDRVRHATRMMKEHLEHSLSSTFALAAILRQSDGKIDDFEDIAAGITDTYEGITNIQLAPRGVVRQIYPLTGNEAAIGHDLLADDARKHEALKAIDERELTLAGPFELIQGGTAMIGRLPIFLEDKSGREAFWGFSSALIMMSDFLKRADINSLAADGYEYQLWRVHPDSGKRHVFARSSKKPLVNPVSVPFQVPSGQWTLSVYVPDDYGAVDGRLILELSLILFVAGLLGLTVLRTLGQSAQLAGLVKIRTEELRELNEELQGDLIAKRRAKNLSDAINETTSITNANLDFDVMMQQVAERSATAIGAKHAMIALNEEGKFLIRFVYGYPAGLIGTELTAEDGPEHELSLRDGEPVVVNEAATDDRVNRRTMGRLGIKSLMVLPLKIGERMVGTLSFYYYHQGQDFQEVEIDYARKLSAALSLAVENHNLYSTQSITLETLQRALLDAPSYLPGIDFGHIYHSATEVAVVGGDFYELFELSGQEIGIVIGDVSGHGIPAANLASRVKNTVKAFSFDSLRPAQVMSKTNEIVSQSTDPSVFATAFYGVLNTKTGLMTYCNSGHPSAVIKRSDGAIVLLESNSPIIGAMESFEFKEDQITVDHNDLVILYTDGITEARRNKEFFSEQRLIEVVAEAVAADVAKVPDLIMDRALKFSGGILTDDVAILALTRSGINDRRQMRDRRG